MKPDFTIVTDNAPATLVRKGFSVCDAMAKSDFGMADAAKMGITCNMDAVKVIMDSEPELRKAFESFAQDNALTLGEGNIDALGQFFLYIHEATINPLYRGRTAVQTFGTTTMGDWTTEKIAFKTRELVCPGPVVYDDWSRAPYAAYNYGWDTRDTIRLEWALEVTKLEEAVAGVMRRNAYKDKKDGIVLSKSIWDNEYFWYGTTGSFTSPKRLYGILNEPNLAGRKTNLPEGTKSLGDSTITTEEVCAHFRLFKQDLVDSLQGNGDIETLPVEILMPLKYQTALTVQNTYGYTCNKWLQENWKAATISYKPELDDADDGDPLVMVYVKSIPEVGMDTINLIETSKLRLIGAMPSLKGREESYSSSVAGAICAAPMAVRLWAGPAASGE